MLQLHAETAVLIIMLEVLSQFCTMRAGTGVQEATAAGTRIVTGTGTGTRLIPTGAQATVFGMSRHACEIAMHNPSLGLFCPCHKHLPHQHCMIIKMQLLCPS